VGLCSSPALRLSMSLKLSPLMLTMNKWCRTRSSIATVSTVAGEGCFPFAEGEIRGEDHRAAFVALRYDPLRTMRTQIAPAVLVQRICRLSEGPSMSASKSRAPTAPSDTVGVWAGRAR
jgi:hypothetical protein